MKKHFIIANWKSYKTQYEVSKWVESFTSQNAEWLTEDLDVVVCPPFVYLPTLQNLINTSNLSIQLGAQDVSPFGEGSYTGSINTKQAQELATYAIVGHSERRKYFHETDADVLAKIKMLLETAITPVLCISDIQQLSYYLKEDNVLVSNADNIVFVYEPPGAISGGGSFHPEDPISANANAGKISELIGKKVITLYGGSVNPDNAKGLFSKEHIAGGLIGQASLDPEKFVKIIQSF